MILQKVSQIVADCLGLYPQEITEDLSFEEDLEVHALDLYEILTAVEETFDIEIAPDAAEHIRTVRDLIEVIKVAEE
ncbi:MAG: acyl carrier protein [Lachnospiraceae bacterium]|nr:acyl carrier protein [Lachnospiraceae bacterium]